MALSAQLREDTITGSVARRLNKILRSQPKYLSAALIILSNGGRAGAGILLF
jgi:hypothetical protein